jgi:mannose-1-phosphate guanylyltransferase/mannose-6-phosphate isomerase
VAVYPVIMCGGSGVRLWPASRSDRPKQFADLLGPRSSFQETVLRVAGVEDAARPLVVGGLAHGDLIAAQLEEIGVVADLLLEPGPRDSAAAMAAAALWVRSRDPDAILAVVSADHHIPDPAAFREAIARAADHARRGWIVTLGVRPDAPSTAYGYIRAAAGEGPRAIAAFVEKPDLETAKAYVTAGDLWNSGNFIAPAALLVAELEAHAPQVLAAARAGLDAAGEIRGATVLGPAFLTAPKISIDYAVMEKTARAAVLPVQFAWSDVGAWDAVLAVSARDGDGNHAQGDAVLLDTTGSYVRAGAGTRVVTVGLTDVAVVTEGGDVLVCALDRSQAVKTAVDGLASPRRFASLPEASSWYDRWLRTAALPLWWALGADHARGGFFEALSSSGEPRPAPRRGRVQGRQVFVYAQAGALGWEGPWRQAAWHGLDYMLAQFQRPDGLLRTLVSLDGAPLDETAAVYDQAFALLGMASLHAMGPSRRDLVAEASRVRDGLGALRHPRAGFRETGDQPFQANAHMHMFEAALEWAASNMCRLLGRHGRRDRRTGPGRLHRRAGRAAGILRRRLAAQGRRRWAAGGAGAPVRMGLAAGPLGSAPRTPGRPGGGGGALRGRAAGRGPPAGLRDERPVGRFHRAGRRGPALAADRTPESGPGPGRRSCSPAGGQLPEALSRDTGAGRLARQVPSRREFRGRTSSRYVILPYHLRLPGAVRQVSTTTALGNRCQA